VTTPPPMPAPPTSAAVVAVQLSMDPADPAVLERLEPTVAAVNVLVPRMASTPAAAQALGAAMLAARLYRRRNSPEGVATFTAEGAVYVQRNDPDIGMLLGIGAYAPPVVG
jgi:hypothetical protein